MINPNDPRWEIQRRLTLALEEVLDAAERARMGFPIESEEWYIRRDFARIVLADVKDAEAALPSGEKKPQPHECTCDRFPDTPRCSEQLARERGCSVPSGEKQPQPKGHT